MTTQATASDEEREILEAIERWAERELRPVAKRFDHAEQDVIQIGQAVTPSGARGLSRRAGSSPRR